MGRTKSKFKKILNFYFESQKNVSKNYKDMLLQYATTVKNVKGSLKVK